MSTYTLYCVVVLEIVEILILWKSHHTPFGYRRSKLFRFDKSTNEWKERGTGDVKLLKHKESGKIRLLMRRDKTHKICANHYGPVFPFILPCFFIENVVYTRVLTRISHGRHDSGT